MKKYGMLVLAFAFILSFAVSAQEQLPQGGERAPRPEMRQGGNRMQVTPQMRAENLAKQLDLTADQKSQVQALYEKQNAEREKKMADAKASGGDFRSKFEAERKAQDDDLAKIIGQEKMKKLQDMRAERMKQRGENAPKPQQNDVK